MSQWCGFNQYMQECIRYALMFNEYSRHARYEHTYKEFPIYPYSESGCKYIDVVGKHDIGDSIKRSIAVEIKSGWADFNSGHGLNLYANFNFIAVTEGDFSRELLYFMSKNRRDWKNVGLIEVLDDGSVETLIPAEEMWARFVDTGVFYIENHWSELAESKHIKNNDELEEIFQSEVVPLLENDDKIRKSLRKQYPVERLITSCNEYNYYKLRTSKAFRNNVLKFDDGLIYETA